MIGLDTNVLVRYIMQDDPRQSARASRLIESLTADEPGFVSIIAVIELVWVLTSAYGLTRRQVAQAVESLLRTQELVLDRADQIALALRAFNRTTSDFADSLIETIGATAGCTSTLTFDVGAAKHARMVLVP